MFKNFRIKLGDFLISLGRKIHPVCRRIDEGFKMAEKIAKEKRRNDVTNKKKKK